MNDERDTGDKAREEAEWRGYVEERITMTESRIDDLHTCIKGISDKVDKLHNDHKSLSSDITELLSIFRAGKGAVRVFGWFGVAVRWVVGVGIAVAAIVAFMKGGFHQ